MTGIGKGINQPQPIGDAGAILRSLTPAKIATLVLVRDGESNQRAIADRLDRTSPAVFKYIETLENLPTPLIERDERDMWVTPLGKQILSALDYFTADRVDTGIQSDWTGETVDERLDQLDCCLSPLHEFRSDPPYYILYGLGCGGTSTDWLADPDPAPVTVDDLTATVKGCLNDSITRAQIWERLRKFEDADTIEVGEEYIELTDKGIGQSRLLDQIVQSFLNTTSLADTDDGIAAVYQADTGMTLHLPRTLTVDELDAIVSDFKQNSRGDLNLELVTQTRAGSED